MSCFLRTRTLSASQQPVQNTSAVLYPQCTYSQGPALSLWSLLVKEKTQSLHKRNYFTLSEEQKHNMSFISEIGLEMPSQICLHYTFSNCLSSASPRTRFDKLLFLLFWPLKLNLSKLTADIKPVPSWHKASALNSSGVVFLSCTEVCSWL